MPVSRWCTRPLRPCSLLLKKPAEYSLHFMNCLVLHILISFLDKILTKYILFIERECIEFIYCQYTPSFWRVISNTLPLWKKIAMHCLESGWIGKYTRQCIITFFKNRSKWYSYLQWKLIWMVREEGSTIHYCPFPRSNNRSKCFVVHFWRLPPCHQRWQETRSVGLVREMRKLHFWGLGGPINENWYN